MVYKKYIKRGGKSFGPYFYENYRENGVTKTRYLGKFHKNNLWGNKNLIIFFGVFLLAILSIFFYILFSSGLTERATLEVAPSYSIFEKISGNLLEFRNKITSKATAENSEDSDSILVGESLEITESSQELSESTNSNEENIADLNIASEQETIPETNETEIVESNQTIISETNITESSEQETIPETNETEIVESNQTILEVNITQLIEDKINTKNAKIIVGRPVKWIKSVELETKEEQINITIPKQSENITIKTGEEVQQSLEEFENYENIINDADKNDFVKGQITGMVSLDLNSKNSFLVRLWKKITSFTITGNAISEQEAKTEDLIKETETEKIIQADEVAEITNETKIAVEYYTDAPKIVEENLTNGKKITISAADELNYTNILAYAILGEELIVTKAEQIQLKWDNNSTKENVQFEVYDLDENGFFDYIEWTVPHLSSQTYEITNLSTSATTQQVVCEGGGNFCHLGINDTGLALYMPFEGNNKSTTEYTYTSNNFDGLLGNTTGGTEPKWNSTGKYGGAYSFDGVNDRIELGISDYGIVATDQFTLTAWVNIQSIKTHGIIVRSQYNEPFRMQIEDSYIAGTVSCGVRTSNTVYTDGLFRGIQINNWTMVTCIYNGTTLMVYQNGIYISSILPAQAPIASSTNRALIGATPVGAGSVDSAMNGSIDEVMIFNRSLSATEISNLYNATFSRFYPNGSLTINKSIESGYNRVNITIQTNNQPSTNISLSVFDGSSWSSYKNMSDNIVEVFNLTTTQTNLNLSFMYLSDSNKMWTPIQMNNISINTWNETGEAPPTDNEYPIFFNYWDNNGTIYAGQIAYFNVSINNTNGTVILHVNGANITASNLTSSLFNVTYNFTSSGIYLYNWTSYGNGTNHNLNWSDNKYYTLNISSDDEFPIFFNITSNNASFIGNGTVMISSNINKTNGTAGVQFDGTNYTMSNSSDFFNVSFTKSGSGAYNYYIWAYGNGSLHNFNITSLESYTINYSNLISDCTNITTSGNYHLDNDILNSPTSGCINISANNVALDCQWNTIQGDSSADYAIFAARTVETYTNITIKNCQITNWDTSGVYLYYSNNNTLRNLNVSFNLDDGVHLYLSKYNTLDNLTVRDNGDNDKGIFVEVSSNNIIQNSTLVNNSYYGIEADFSHDNSYKNLIILNSSYYDFYLSGDYCDSELIEVNGTGNKAIVYYTSAVNLQNWNNNISQLILCNADYSVVNNLNISNTGGIKNTNILLLSTGYSNLSNIKINDSFNGLKFDSSSNNLFENISINPNSLSNTNIFGISLFLSDNNIFKNLEAETGYYGAYIYTGSDNNTFYNSRFSDNVIGAYFSGGWNNTIYYSRIENNSNRGLQLAETQNFLAYNNFFNNSGFYGNFIIDPVYNTTWNTTQQAGTRIYSLGTEIGGNYWTNSLSTGYSDTCNDTDVNGFCDSAYDLTTGSNCTLGVTCSLNNTDYLPLSNEYSVLDNEYPIFFNYWDNNGTIYAGQIAYFNVSINNTNGTVILHVNGANITASNLTSSLFNTTYNFTTGGTYLYNWTSYGNGTNHNLNWSDNRYYTVNISIDTTYPLILITSPANSTNTTNPLLNINYNVSDNIALGSCWWTNNSGISNTSLLSCGTNITGVTWLEGLNNITIYVNDTSNNLNSSSVTFNLNSSFGPVINFTNPTPANATTQTNNSLYLNISIVESNLKEIKFNWNGTNYTLYDDNLILLMNFENFSGLGENNTFVKDLSSYNHDGIAVSTTINSSGKYGNSYDFDGNWGYVNLSTSVAPTSELTICAWVLKRDNRQGSGGANEQDIIVRTGTSNTGNFVFEWNGINPDLRFGAGGNISILSANFVSPLNEWNYFCVSYSNANGGSIYVNGLVNSSISGSATDIGTAVQEVYVGGRPGGSDCLNGTIDNLMIWNISLSAGQIQQLYFTNLYKYNSTNWNFYINQTKNLTSGLDYGTYTYQAYAMNNLSNLGSTEIRTVSILASDLEYPIFFNYWDTNASLTDSGIGYFNVSINNTNGTVILHVNGANITASNLTSSLFNTTYNFTTGGTYLYNWTSYGNGTNHNLNWSDNGYYTVNLSSNTFLNITSITPIGSSITNISKDKSFSFLVTINCSGTRGDCENVTLDLRYNQSSSVPDTSISNLLNETPFVILESKTDNEILVALFSTTNELRYLSYNGTNWTETVIGDYSDQVEAIDIGDADNDGLNDIIIGMNVNGGDKVRILKYNSTSGDFDETSITGIISHHVEDIKIGDADNDGLNEIAIAYERYAGEPYNLVKLRYYKYTSGSWTENNITTPRLVSIQDVDIGDIDYDGSNELVALYTNSSIDETYAASLYAYKLSGETWNEIEIRAQSTAAIYSKGERMMIGDANNDGAVEILTGYYNRANQNQNVMAFYKYNLTSGNFDETNVSTSVNAIDGLDLGDLNHDGLNDILIASIANGSSTSTINYFSNVTGASELIQLDEEIAATSRDAQIGDADNDKISDVLTVRQAYLKLHQDVGGESPVESTPKTFSVSIDSAQIGDIDNDGRNNPVDIGTISAGNSITFNITIQATGEIGTSWLLNVNASSEGKNSSLSESIQININSSTPSDTTSPSISITSPINSTNSTNTGLNVNYTISDTNLQSCWYTNSSGIINYSIGCGTNITNQTWSQGRINVTIYANDTLGNSNSSSVSFFIDSLPPYFNHVINNFSIYDNSSFEYDINATDSGIGLQNYSINDTINFNINNSGTIRNITGLTEKIYYLNISINDSLGNRNSSIFYVNVTTTPDTTRPSINFTNPTPANATIQNETSVYINISSNDTYEHFTFLDWNRSLMLWMNMDNKNSTTVYDNSTWGNNGVLGNGTSTTIPVYNSSGRFGGAYTFDGVNELIRVNDANSLSFTNGESDKSFSITAWVKIENEEYFYVASKGSGLDFEYSFATNGSGNLGLGTARQDWWNGYIDTATNENLTSYLGEWIFIAGTYDGSESQNGFGVYINGESKSVVRRLYGTYTGMSNTATPLYIGANQLTGFPYYSNGTIDEVMIWDRVLSASEIRSLYNATAYQYYNNFTDLTAGNYTYQAYAQDTAGNINSTELREVQIFGVDNEYPQFSNYNINIENNSQYYFGISYNLNVTITSTNGTAGIEFNNTNYTLSNIFSMFNKTLTGLSAGVYSYYYWAYGNGTAHYYNVSGVKYYTIAKNTTHTITPLLNGANANLSIIYPQQINVSYTGTNYTLATLSINGTSVNIGTNYTWGAGGWVVNYSLAENTNYSAYEFLIYLIINKSGNPLDVKINGVTSNISLTYPQQVNVSINGNLTTTTILLNGTALTNSLNYTLGAGGWVANVSSIGDQNYSSNISYWLIEITKNTPVLTFLANGLTNNLSLTYPQQVNISATSNYGIVGLDKDDINYLTNNAINLTFGGGSYIFRANVTGNQNYTNLGYSYYNITITKFIQSITPLLNGVTADLSITYPQQINVSYTGTNYTLATLSINGTSVNIGTNYTWGAGGWVVNYSLIGNQNYSGQEYFLNLSINKTNSLVYLYLNNSRANSTVLNSDFLLINTTLITGEGNVTLYINSTIVNQTTSIGNITNNYNFTIPGILNITSFYFETQNYSQGSETFYVTVRNLTASPIISLSTPANGASSTSTTTTFEYLVLDDISTNCSLILNNEFLNFNSSVNIEEIINSFVNSTPVGSYTWTINCTDKFNNFGNSSIRSFTIISPVTPSGGSTGGSSGGTPVIQSTVELKSNPESITLEGVAGEVSSNQIKLSNLRNKEIFLTVSTLNLDTILILRNKTLKISPNQDVIFEFDTIIPEQPGVYVGKLIFSYEGKMLEVPFVLISQSPNSLFDTSVYIPDNYKEISLGEKLNFQVDLVEVGLGKQMDVTINYIIKDFNGKTYLKESETFFVLNQKSYKTGLQTQNLPVGEYILEIELIYPDGVAFSSAQFKIIDSKPKKTNSLLVGLLIVIIFVFFMLILVIKRYKRMNAYLKKGNKLRKRDVSLKRK